MDAKQASQLLFPILNWSQIYIFFDQARTCNTAAWVDGSAKNVSDCQTELVRFIRADRLLCFFTDFLFLFFLGRF